MRSKFLWLLLLFGVASALATWAFLYREWVSGTAAAGVAIVAALYLVREYRHHIHQITLMLTALEHNDSTFRFREGKDYYNRLFVQTLNRINEMFAKEKRHVREQERFFELILDKVATGLLIVNEKDQIVHHNQQALQLLDLNVLTHLSQLKRIHPQLHRLCSEMPEKGPHSVSYYNERGEVHLSVQITRVLLSGQPLRIVALNDIGEELEANEIESWTRLIRVLTHEIMNTVTPIASLSETLGQLTREQGAAAYPRIQEGLEVITGTSRGLIQFVDSYRSLTRIPTPNKQPLDLSELIHRVLTLEKDALTAAGVQTRVQMTPTPLFIYADLHLLTQVLVNLVKNALAAFCSGAEGPGAGGPRQLRFDAWLDAETEAITLDVSNNGAPIAASVQAHLFVPFFTTKPSGTGIGLSLSRQIMRAHGGSLKLKCSSAAQTTFTLVFN